MSIEEGESDCETMAQQIPIQIHVVPGAGWPSVIAA
jgi:hypothetical protein